MAFALSPVTQFGTKEKAARLYHLATEISNSTSSDEPECRAYCWFWESSIPAVTAVVSRTRPGDEYGGIIRLRGLEVYANGEALTLVHRNSEAYKAMRKAVVDEELYLGNKLPELTFMAPVTRIGFLSRDGNRIDFAQRNDVSLLVTEFRGLDVSLEDKLMHKLDGVLDVMTDHQKEDGDTGTSARNIGLLTYLVTKTEARAAEGGKAAGVEGSTIIDVLLFECFETSQACREAWGKSKVYRDEAGMLAKGVAVSCWGNAIGFIRG